MRHFLIDGNNLIGKIKELRNCKDSSRKRLIKMLNLYFSGKGNKVTLYFDGHLEDNYLLTAGKIEYSGRKAADDIIRTDIERAKNPKQLTVISSDYDIINLARVCSCEIIKSEDFAQQLNLKKDTMNETDRINGISNNEIKRLFGL